MLSQRKSEDEPILRARRLTYALPQGLVIVGPIDQEFSRGGLYAVIGPNGAGKSTLLRLFVGLLAPTNGEVLLYGRALRATPFGQRARHIAFLPQHPVAPPSATADEIVRMGRHPYRRLRLFESPDDLAISHECMQMTETQAFASRRMETLSGGEAQRVHVAAALAQQPQVLALDEPTTGLDLYHQIHIFRLLRELSRVRGLSVIVVTHELNLAAWYCDHVTLLSAGRLVAAGAPASVLVARNLEPVYGVRFATLPGNDPSRPYLVARECIETGRERQG